MLFVPIFALPFLILVIFLLTSTIKAGITMTDLTLEIVPKYVNIARGKIVILTVLGIKT